MNKHIFTGAGVALITPMHSDGSVNFEELARLLEFQVENGTDAIIACGTTGEAATRYLNLALPVTDGMKIYVPREDEVVTAAIYTEPVNDTSGPVNINTADVASLMRLSGIGERKAEDIVAFREEHGLFQTAEDIMNVPGIKTALYEKIRGDICVK